MAKNESPASLVAIAYAARQAKDRDLERAAKTELRDRFGIRVIFGESKGAKQ